MKFAVLFAAVLFFSCQGKTEQKQEVVSEESPSEIAQNDSLIGIQPSLEKVYAASQLSQMNLSDSIVVVRGTVTEVCKMKGCWMNLDQGNGNNMRVTFKDYALFVPKDLPGQEVIIRGVASQQTLSVETLRHYAEDAGESAEEVAKITEPETVLSFEADGVLILSPSTLQ